MKYFIRCIKYLIYFVIIFCLIVGLIYLFNKPAEGGIAGMFQEGAFLKIAVLFIAIAAVYPSIGFHTKKAAIDGTWADHSERFMRLFKDLGYEQESDNGSVMTFRLRSKSMRVTRMWEDRITVDYSGNPILVEGLTRDASRIAGSLTYFSREGKQEE